jgi:hypothetical protein
VRKLRRADELAAVGRTGEEIAAELGVSATLYNWRRAYGGMDIDAAKELKELREQKRPPVVTVTAADLITARLGPTEPEHKAAAWHVKFDGDRDAVDAMRTAFRLSADPRLAVAMVEHLLSMPESCCGTGFVAMLPYLPVHD